MSILMAKMDIQKNRNKRLPRYKTIRFEAMDRS